MSIRTATKSEVIALLMDKKLDFLLTVLKDDMADELVLVSVMQNEVILSLLLQLIHSVSKRMHVTDRRVLLIDFENPTAEHTWNTINPSITLQGCKECWEVAWTRLLYEVPQLREVIEKAILNYTLLKEKKDETNTDTVHEER